MLIVDDIIASGGTALASADLIKRFKPQEINFFFIISLYNLDGFTKIEKNYNAKSIIQTEG